MQQQQLENSATAPKVLVPRAPLTDRLSAHGVNGRYQAPDEESLYRAYFENSAEGLFIIDVGLDVWFAIHDWHVKHLQQPALGRDANGRYTISVMGTQLVMRPDLVPTFISAPYDSR